MRMEENIHNEMDTENSTINLRLPEKFTFFMIGMLISFQVFAVYAESQWAASMSWYAIYAIVILVTISVLNRIRIHISDIHSD